MSEHELPAADHASPALDRHVESAAPPAGEASPGVADGSEHRLDPRSILASRVAGGVSVAVLAVVSFIALVSILFASGARAALVLALLGAWLVGITGIAVLTFVWPPVRYRHTSYRVDHRGIRIRRGVLWRSETTVPRSRVQHTDVSRGPIERYFGLATLVIHTAGTENASVSLGGLAEPSAYPVRDYLIEGGDDDAV